MGVGGADRVTLQLMQNLSREEYQIELVLMRAEGRLLDDVPKDVRIHDCQTRSLWFMIAPLRRIIKNGSYDLIYATCGGASIPLMLALLTMRTRPTTVVSERNILVHPHKSQWKRSLMNLLKRWLYQHADWVTVVSKALGQEVNERLYVAPEKIQVVNNPVVDEALIRQSEEEVTHPFFAHESNQVILAVGRLVHQKDFSSLIKGFGLYVKRKQDDSIRLLILGEGPLRPQLMLQIEDLGLEKQVDLPGYDKNPFRYMSNCTLFILSSLHEGMPGVLVQAMACGAACISTDCPTGPNEIIEHGASGLLVPVGDHQAIANAIETFLTNSTLRKQMAQAAPASVRRYETQAGIRSYFSFLEE